MQETNEGNALQMLEEKNVFIPQTFTDIASNVPLKKCS